MTVNDRRKEEESGHGILLGPKAVRKRPGCRNPWDSSPLVDPLRFRYARRAGFHPTEPRIGTEKMTQEQVRWVPKARSCNGKDGPT